MHLGWKLNCVLSGNISAGTGAQWQLGCCALMYECEASCQTFKKIQETIKRPKCQKSNKAKEPLPQREL